MNVFIPTSGRIYHELIIIGNHLHSDLIRLQLSDYSNGKSAIEKWLFAEKIAPNLHFKRSKSGGQFGASSFQLFSDLFMLMRASPCPHNAP